MLFFYLLTSLILSTLASDFVDEEKDGPASRKILGSSVVTSVSVITNSANGKPIYTDAIGRPVPKPNIASQIASPINLLNPDKYEFYTFNNDGELVKRLMTLDEIQGIIAGGDGENTAFNSDFNSQYPNPEQEVDNIVENVQNVLQKEIEAHKNFSSDKITLDTPDVSDSWDTILTTFLGTTGNSLAVNDLVNQGDIEVIKPTTLRNEPFEVTAYNNVVNNDPEIVNNVNISPLPSLTDVISANAQNYQQLNQQSSTPEVIEKNPALTQFIMESNIPSSTSRISSTEETDNDIKIYTNSEEYSSTYPTKIESKSTPTSSSTTAATTSKEPINISDITKMTTTVTPMLKLSTSFSTTENTIFNFENGILETKNSIQSTENKNVEKNEESSTVKMTSPEITSLNTPQQQIVAETKTTITSFTTGSTENTHDNLITDTVTTEAGVNKNTTQTTIDVPITTIKPTTLMPLNELIKTFYAQTILNNTTEPPKNYTKIPITTVKPMLNKTATTTIRPIDSTTDSKPNVELINRFSAPLLNSQPQVVKNETIMTTEKSGLSSTIDNMSIDADMMSEINQFIANALESIDVENLQTEKYNVENVLDNSLNNKNIMKETTTVTSNLLDNSSKSTSQLTTEWKEIYSSSSEKYKENLMKRTTVHNPSTESLLKENYEILINESNSTTNKPEQYLYNMIKNVTQFKSTTETLPSSFTTTKHTTKFTVTKPDIQTSNFTNKYNMISTMANISTKKESNATQKPTTSSINLTTTMKPISTTIKLSDSTVKYVQSTENKIKLPTVEEGVSKFNNLSLKQNTTTIKPSQSTVKVNTTTVKPTMMPVKISSSIKSTSSTIKISSSIKPTSSTIKITQSTKPNTTKYNTTKPNNSIIKPSTPISKPVTQTTESNLFTSKQTSPTTNIITSTAKPKLTTSKSTFTAQKVNYVSSKPNTTTKLSNSQIKSNATTKPNSISKVNVTTAKPNNLSKNNMSVRPIVSETKSSNSTITSNKFNTNKNNSTVTLNKFNTNYNNSTVTSNKFNTNNNNSTVTSNKFNNNYNNSIVTSNKFNTNNNNSTVTLNKFNINSNNSIITTNKFNTNLKTPTESSTKSSLPTIRPNPSTILNYSTIKSTQTTKSIPKPSFTTPKSTSTIKINTIIERLNITNHKESTEKNPIATKPKKPNITYLSNTKPNVKVNNTLSKTNVTSNLLHNSSSTLLSTIKIGNQSIPQMVHKHTVSSNLSVTNISEPYRKTDDSWKLVATIPPPHLTTKLKIPKPTDSPLIDYYQQTSKIDLTSQGNFGMPNLSEDMQMFSKLYNELALKLWSSLSIDQISSERSVIFSSFGKISLLAMIYLGARGGTSGEMNDLLKLDDIATFNPHLKFKEVTESITKRQGAAIIRELYSDNTKGRILDFYKERARNFYDGHVEEIDFKFIKDVVKRRTNLMIKKQTRGYMQQYLDDTSFNLKGPLAALSMNIFQADCMKASTKGRDGELYFIVLPSLRQRRLVPIPAAVWNSGFLAGYDPELDATAVSLGNMNQAISTIFVIPGQQGHSAPGDVLLRLEARLLNNTYSPETWNQLLKSMLPRPNLEVQLPRFSHKSIINMTNALKRMGLNEMFNPKKADFTGLTGSVHNLYFSDILQVNEFSVCGETQQVHMEAYPSVGNETEQQSEQVRTIKYFDYEENDNSDLPLPLRPRQARVPEVARLRFDRPFLYFVRHNPTGLILHMGRFNPKLLP